MGARVKTAAGIGVIAVTVLLLVSGYLTNSGPSGPRSEQNTTATPTPAHDQSAAASPKPDGEGYTAEVSHEKAKEVQDEITLSEQIKITEVLLKKLSASDLKLFQTLFDNGMPLDEKRKAKKVIMQKLTEEEYDELIAIAAKYGLSKGKSYEESLREQK